MGKISEIPKLRRALDERMAKLGGEGVGMSDKTAEVFFDGRRVGHVSSVTFRAPTLPEEPSEALDENAALLAENARLSDHLSAERSRATMANVEWEKWRRLYYAKLNENDALQREVALLRANAEKVKTLRESMTRFNPATGREEPFDPFAVLKDIRKQVPNDKRFEGYTLVGAVAEMARLLRQANLDAAVLSTMRSQRVEPGSLVTLSAPEGTTHGAVFERLANALHNALAERFGSMTYGAPTVLLLPPGGQAQVITPQGRGPVQVQIREPGAPARPTDVPKHVAQAYAEAAAASYGVTPAVVRAKRASRRLLRAVANRVNARIAEDISPFITPEVRRERRPIGREIIAYDDPAELMLADAEG
jgi:hypothetical protein